MRSEPASFIGLKAPSVSLIMFAPKLYHKASQSGLHKGSLHPHLLTDSEHVVRDPSRAHDYFSARITEFQGVRDDVPEDLSEAH